EQLLESLAEKLELSKEIALSTISRCGLAVHDDSDEEQRDEIQTMRLVLTPGFRSIADEVDQAFSYAASVTRGAPSRKIYLSGSLARWPGATDFLQEICGTPVECFPSPFAGIAHETGPVPESGELAIATGLAMRGVTDDV
ncbi:MAG: pilus assembly protein PilM, partial [Gammaproteobacteria bacterium]|nr:pilus assembly protein PilM [Gammaproteobacteria bacterium]